MNDTPLKAVPDFVKLFPKRMTYKGAKYRITYQLVTGMFVFDNGWQEYVQYYYLVNDTSFGYIRIHETRIEIYNIIGININKTILDLADPELCKHMVESLKESIDNFNEKHKKWSRK